MSAQVIIKPGREKSLKRKHPWVFSGAIAKLKGKPLSGEVVDVISSQGEWLCRGSYSPSSQIRVRAWTFSEHEFIDDAFFERRLRRALASRQHAIRLGGLTGFRLVASENDQLPGITIDKFDNVLVCQLLTAGAEFFKTQLTQALLTLFPAHIIYERSDVEVRKKEDLPLLKQVLAGEMPNAHPQIQENGFTIEVDIEHGHKTGFYLDQRDSRAAIEPYVDNKRVLNCFCYTGTFALYALRGGASHVTNIDVSDTALQQAQRHAEINALDMSKLDNVKADVFKQLREYKAQGETFDVIIMDPPKFVDNKSQITSACRGYKDINRLAMEILNPNGLLFTFSCSGLVSEELFQKVVADAALDAKRDMQFIQRLGQAADHPVLSTFPEGFYLKGFICQMMD